MINTSNIMELEKINIELLSATPPSIEFNKLDDIIFDLDSQIDMLSSKVAKWDCLVALGSGILCSMMDILWVDNFSLAEGRDISSQKVDNLVKKAAHILGCESDDLRDCVKFLEEKFPIPADGNTPDFGGGLQHHLRDFAHHPTIIGLIFSLLTQFTHHSFGTDTSGNFLPIPVPENSEIYIGKDIPSKIFNGTLIWFFHLISDIAGSSSTARLSGGTGIPGPILSIAKEMSVLPFFRNLEKDDMSVSVLLSKLFNGTLFAEHDENGRIIKGSEIKLDFRGELGLAYELKGQVLPVIANDCIVRTFYMIRQLAKQLKQIHVTSIHDFRKIDVKGILPTNSPTLTRMLTISTAVFSSLDVSAAIITKKYWVSINYIGIGRFTLALGDEMVWTLKRRDLKNLKSMYETINRYTYTDSDQRIYERLGKNMEYEKFGLSEEQTKILYNIEYYKTLHDIESTKLPVGGDKISKLKKEWLDEWKSNMTQGFAGFVQNQNAELDWYTIEELHEKIRINKPDKPWFRLVLLEAMLFEPYFPLSTEINKKGNEVPSKKYLPLNNPVSGYKKGDCDKYLDYAFSENYQLGSYVNRLRKCYDKVCRELNEVLKTAFKGLAIAAGIAIVTVVAAGALAPAIAVALVGSNFAGLSGAALTSACLAYLGGGAIAAGGFGMAGGTVAIIGGGAVLGIGIGTGVGGVTGASNLASKKDTILQSAKLMVSVREIFLNDEKDVEYCSTVYETYVQNIVKIEKNLVEIRLRSNTEVDKKKKKDLEAEIKETENSLEAMKIAAKSMRRFISSYEEGMNVSD